MNTLTHSRILVFSDFDGTIIDIHTYSIAQELADFLSRNKRIILVLVTSRAWDGVEPYKDLLNLQAAQITENGAVIIDPLTLEIVYKKSIPLDSEEMIKKIADKHRLIINFAGAGKQVGRISLVGPIDRIHNMLPELEAIPKITFVADRQAGSLDKCLIDITPEKVDKLTGVQEWLRLYPGNYEKIYTVGNSLSDVPLFKTKQFIRVAVEDGASELKQRADLIIPSASQQGFLRLLGNLSPSFLLKNRL